MLCQFQRDCANGQWDGHSIIHLRSTSMNMKGHPSTTNIHVQARWTRTSDQDMLSAVQEWDMALYQEDHLVLLKLLDSAAAELPAALLTPHILVSCAVKATDRKAAADVVIAVYRLALLRLVEAPQLHGVLLAKV